MNSIVENILMHYGMPRRSGRYPYGSGENPYQHSGDFLSRVQELKKSGMSETDIAKNMGLTTTQLRIQMSLAKDERRALQVATAKGLREKGYSLNEIADKMGFANDSSVRSLLNETSENRMNQAKATADVLRKLIEEKGMIDELSWIVLKENLAYQKKNSTRLSICWNWKVTRSMEAAFHRLPILESRPILRSFVHQVLSIKIFMTLRMSIL